MWHNTGGGTFVGEWAKDGEFNSDTQFENPDTCEILEIVSDAEGATGNLVNSITSPKMR